MIESVNSIATDANILNDVIEIFAKIVKCKSPSC